jgi:hypothetical protein
LRLVASVHVAPGARLREAKCLMLVVKSVIFSRMITNWYGVETQSRYALISSWH